MKFKEISFIKAMKMIDRGEINNLYFEANGAIQCAKNWRIDVVALPEKKWFKRKTVGDV